MNSPERAAAQLPPPLRVQRAGESALLADYPDTSAVLAAAAAVQHLDPPHLRDLVPAETTLLLVGADARDLEPLRALLDHLPAAGAERATAGEQRIGVVYDGEDLEQTAHLLDLSTDTLISAHSGAVWTAAFGGFAPGFAYLVAEEQETPGSGADGPVGPPWDVPRRTEPRTAVPAGAVGLAARYCGIYPRSSPGGWQLIGRSDAPLFDVQREPPALLTPGTRVRFVPQRPTVRTAAGSAALAQVTQVAQEAAAVPARLGRRRPATAPSAATGPPAAAEPRSDSAPRRSAAASSSNPAVLEVLSPGPLALLEDAGRPGRAAMGVSTSGAFDRGAMLRANLAVGNPPGAAVLEAVAGPLHLRARAAAVVALSGARAPLVLRRADEDGAAPELDPEQCHELPIALDPGDVLELGAVTDGLRLVLAVRGGLSGVGSAGAVLGSLSHDTLSALGPAPLQAGDVLHVGPEAGLDAVAAPLREELSEPSAPALEVPVHAGPRDALLGAEALAQLLETTWRVRPDSDRVGVRLDGEPLAAPGGAGALPSEPMVAGAIQVPPSGLPVVFGPDHPTTGGYPVIAVVTRAGLDSLAQARAGAALRFVRAQ